MSDSLGVKMRAICSSMRPEERDTQTATHMDQFVIGLENKGIGARPRVLEMWHSAMVLGRQRTRHLTQHDSNLRTSND